MMMSSGKKWELSLIAAALFVLLSAPFTYNLTNMLAEKLKFQTVKSGGPTIYGLLTHFVVFFLIFRILLCFV
jgi:hypothetical protein